MIRFKFGRGAAAIVGTYDLENGIVMATPGEVAADLAQSLESDIDHLIATSPHAVTGAFAMARRVLERWGATIDASEVPKPDPDAVT